MPLQRPSTVWRRSSGLRPGTERRRSFNGRLEWVCFQSLSKLLLQYMFWSGCFCLLEVCRMFNCFAVVPWRWRMLGLRWTSSEENALTTTLVQPLWNNESKKRTLFTIHLSCEALEWLMNEQLNSFAFWKWMIRTRLYTSKYQINKVLLFRQLHHFHAPLLLLRWKNPTPQKHTEVVNGFLTSQMNALVLTGWIIPTGMLSPTAGQKGF